MIENKKDNQLGIKSVTHILGEELSQEAKNLLVRLSNQEKIIKYAKFDSKRGCSKQSITAVQSNLLQRSFNRQGRKKTR